jgi:hypothetical protein
MLMNRPFQLLLLLPAIALASTEAAALGPSRYLTGSVSFDSGTNLYTYSYTVDTAGSSDSVGEVAILVDSLGYYTAPDPLPIPHSIPQGFYLVEAVSGSIEDEPYNIAGTMYAWQALAAVDPVPAGGTLSGFSFSAPFPPAEGDGNNYFLYSYDAREIVDYGRVVAPDFLGRFIVPEPTAGAFAGTLALFFLSHVRKRRKADVTCREACKQVHFIGCRYGS